MSKNYRLAKSLVRLREQINELYPDRDKASDGWIGNAEHASRKSDHNPWVTDAHGVGVVTATDTDEDLSPAIHSIEGIVSAIRASRDPRVKYIIYEERITVEGSDLQQWKPYHGVNPHRHHCHISVKSDPRHYDDASDWSIGGVAVSDVVLPATPAENGGAIAAPPRDLKIGDVGQDVRNLQAALKIKVDGDFGRATRATVIQFQTNAGLRPDGIVGANTRKELDL